MNPTPLEVAAALRSAAEFCRDPDSPKASYQPARDANRKSVPPCSQEAVEWCAFGYAAKVLGIGHERGDMIYIAFHRVGIAVDSIWPVFDQGRYEEAAVALDSEAASIEASLPLAAESVTRDEVTV